MPDDNAKISQLERENALLKQTLSQSERVAKIGRNAISDLKKSQQALRLSDKVMKNALEGIMVTDANGIIEVVNPAFTIITGFTAEDAIRKKPNILSSGKHKEAFYKEMWKTILTSDKWSGEIWNRRKNGEIYPSWLTISTIKDNKDKITNYVGIFTDITKQKIFEKNLQHLAYSDGLTGIPNRIAFEQQLEYTIKVSKRQGKMFAVFFMDLDHFKEVNDVYGHNAGDLVLQEAAHRFQTCIREEDILARFGGDEYGIVILELTNKDQIKIIAQEIIDVISKPFKIENNDCHVGISIGISFYPHDAQDMESLLKKADKALYKAKESGRNQFVI
jgi:diguanylate cyclase (GGDEF)-like protein/PAS domain S-box-containing protein